MKYFRKTGLQAIAQEALSLDEEDRLMNLLHRTIRGAVKVLAVLMVLTILWGVVDVGFILYQQLLAPSMATVSLRNMVPLFSVSLAPIVAIAVFVNIICYIQNDVMHVKLVLATALMAIARKVIIFDFSEIAPLFLFGTAIVVLALGITYWLIGQRFTWGQPDRL
jgi:uncharacterized membrane protein (DUF373 family)